MNANTFTMGITITPPQKKEKYQIIAFRGDLDKAGLISVKGTLEAFIETFDEVYLVFDFSQLNFINSESIGFLTTIHTRLKKKNKNLVVISAHSNVRDVFEVIGLFNVIEYYESLSAFLEHLEMN